MYNDQVKGDLADQTKYTLEEFDASIVKFKTQISQNKELNLMFNNNIRSMKAAHCQFTFSQTLDPQLQDDEDISRTFNIKRMLTGEEEVVKQIKE